MIKYLIRFFKWLTCQKNNDNIQMVKTQTVVGDKVIKEEMVPTTYTPLQELFNKFIFKSRSEEFCGFTYREKPDHFIVESALFGYDQIPINEKMTEKDFIDQARIIDAKINAYLNNKKMKK